MAFKIKDLMINIAPALGAPIGCHGGKMTNLVGCQRAYTYVGCPGERTNWDTCRTKHTTMETCRGKHTTMETCRGKHTTYPGWGPDEVLEDLTEIKAQLQAALAEVDQDIAEIEDTLRPKTIEEVDELQAKLKEALDELDKIKAGLEKK